MKSPKNIPASVHARLLNRAKKDQRPFSELLQYYAMERFLYRLSRSPHADRFILKGALMLRVWRLPELRPTKDIDMLGKTSDEETDIIQRVADILGTNVEPDGLAFDANSIQSERITEEADYKGIRIHFLCFLGAAKINMQIDVAFGDVVYPEPEKLDFPVMMNSSVPRLLCYSIESSIAEKLEAMVKLGILNSRMKDFYDIWTLSRRFDFVGTKLAEAIHKTFKHRGTEVPLAIEAFNKDFIERKKAQWSAFRERLQTDQVPTSFKEVAAGLDVFITPIIAAISSGTPIPKEWTAPGPWI
ncbi:MAG: nucleotidyl transferase AbiEii/AbiGii toxin family protein [Desulfobacteraceae bacterium]|nr:MAG: nucleotidyl transferase AbiEii/AbiGii toxin family protein [Desulfobacteraceae bacterium]